MMCIRGPSAWLLVALLAVAAAGCARTRPYAAAEAELPALFPDHSLGEIAAFVGTATDTLASLQARAAFSIASPIRNGRFSAEIRERGGDSLYLSISPGLGIEAVRVLVTPDSMFVYDRIENQVTFGSKDEAAAIFPIPLGDDDLSRNIVGHVIPAVDSDWAVRSDDRHYILENPSGTERYIVDPGLWRVVQYEQRSASGEVLERRTFADFLNVDGFLLPRRIEFSRPFDETTVVLTYRTLDPNPSVLSFDLRVRDGARWTHVSEE